MRNSHGHGSDPRYGSRPSTRAEISNREIAKRKGYAPVIIDSVWPKPADGLCEHCRKLRRLVQDHDHKTGRFRGWVCGRCNSALGVIDDVGLKCTAVYLSAE